jgi:hypothetical protein
MDRYANKVRFEGEKQNVGKKTLNRRFCMFCACQSHRTIVVAGCMSPFPRSAAEETSPSSMESKNRMEILICRHSLWPLEKKKAKKTQKNIFGTSLVFFSLAIFEKAGYWYMSLCYIYNSELFLHRLCF